jgi:ferredoxin
MTTYRVSLDSGACYGHGRCYEIAPELFDVDTNGYGTLRHEEVDGVLLEAVRQAARNCTPNSRPGASRANSAPAPTGRLMPKTLLFTHCPQRVNSCPVGRRPVGELG